MSIFKRAHVRGVNHGLMRLGLITYPNEKIAEDAADAVADNLPDEEVPQVTDESGLTPEELQHIIEQLSALAQQLSMKTGGAHDENLNKMAAAVSVPEVAAAHAVALMQKAALESGTTNPGQGSSSSETSTVEAKIDASNNPVSALVTPRGTTEVDTSKGEVGAQSVRPDQPGTQEGGSNDVIGASEKLSSILDKLSADGVLPKSEKRVDLDTNAHMGKDMIVTQGTTHQSTPEVPVPLKQNPAAKGVTEGSKPKTDLQSDVKKAAEILMSSDQGRQIIAKLAEEQAQKQAELSMAEKVLLNALGTSASTPAR